MDYWKPNRSPVFASVLVAWLISKYNALWYVIVPYGQHLDWTLGKFPPIYGPHLF